MKNNSEIFKTIWGVGWFFAFFFGIYIVFGGVVGVTVDKSKQNSVIEKGSELLVLPAMSMASGLAIHGTLAGWLLRRKKSPKA